MCFCVAAVLSAQTLGTVRGIVHDPQHRPLENATVTLGSKTAQSDSNGEFTIDNVPEGPATLRVSAEGFAPLKQQINVTRRRNAGTASATGTGGGEAIGGSLRRAQQTEHANLDGADQRHAAGDRRRPPARIRPTAWR